MRFSPHHQCRRKRARCGLSCEPRCSTGAKKRSAWFRAQPCGTTPLGGWVIHDLQNSIGAVQANFEFLAHELASLGSVSRKSEVDECVQDCRALFRDMARGLRTVSTTTDSSRIVSPCTKNRSSWPTSRESQERHHRRPRPATRSSPSRPRPVPSQCWYPDYLQEALANLIAHILRQPGNHQCQIRISVRVGSPVPVWAGIMTAFLPTNTRESFEPYSRQASMCPSVMAWGWLSQN